MSTIRYAVFTAALTATVAIGGCTGNNAQPRSIHATTSQTMPDGGTQAPSAVATPSPTARAIAQAAGAPGGSARADGAHPGGALPTNVEAYARAFHTAYVARNRARALLLGTKAAVDAAFAKRTADGTFTACDWAGEYTYCSWEGASELRLILRIHNDLANKGRPHAVREASWKRAAPVVPTTVPAYAELFVSHWVRGDRGGAEQLGTPEAVSAIFAAAETPAAAPALRDCEGAAGSSYCTFDGVGYTLIVRLGNEAVQRGELHAVIEVRFAH